MAITAKVNGSTFDPGTGDCIVPQWFSGAGAPAGALGNVDDLYVNETNADWYKKTGVATWTLKGNFIGATGAPGTNGTNGNTMLSTTGAPGAGVGANGDYAIDVAAQILYGPKAAGAWPAGVSIRGNSLKQTYATVNSVAGVLPVIDLSLGNEIIKTTLFENITAAPTFSNPPPAGSEATIRWDVTQATGGTQYTVANPAPGKTAGGAWVNSMTSGAKESVLLVIDSTGAIVKAFPMGVLA